MCKFNSLILRKPLFSKLERLPNSAKLELSTCPIIICGAGVSPAGCSRDGRTTKHEVVFGQVLIGQRTLRDF